MESATERPPTKSAGYSARLIYDVLIGVFISVLIIIADTCTSSESMGNEESNDKTTSKTTSESIGDGEMATSNTASAIAGCIHITTNTSKTTPERIGDVAMISSDTTPESTCNKTVTSSNTTSEAGTTTLMDESDHELRKVAALSSDNDTLLDNVDGINLKDKNADSRKRDEVAITLRMKTDKKIQVSGGKNTTLRDAIESNTHFEKKNAKAANLLPLTKTKCKGIPNLGIPLHLVADEEFSVEFPFKLADKEVLHRTTDIGSPVLLINIDINQNKKIVKRREKHSQVLTVAVGEGESLYEAFVYDGRFITDKLNNVELEEEYKPNNWRALDVNQMICPLDERYKNFQFRFKSTGGKDFYKDHRSEIEQLVGTKRPIKNGISGPSKKDESQKSVSQYLKLNKPLSDELFKRAIQELYGKGIKQLDEDKDKKRYREMLNNVENRIRKVAGFQKPELDQSHLSGALLSKLDRYQKAVGLIFCNGQPLGVGWHVGDRFILTNYHVVYKPLKGIDGLSLDSIFVSFEYKPVGTAEGFLYKSIRKADYPLHYRIVPRIYQYDGSVKIEADGNMNVGDGLDYAILKLEHHIKNPPAESDEVVEELPCVAPSDFHEGPVRGSKVHIIGWSENSENRLVDLNCVILGPDDEASKVRASFFARFPGKNYHTIMLQGSSGSLVVDNEGRPVLLHHGGMMDKIESMFPQGLRRKSLFEEGMSLQAIRNHILEWDSGDCEDVKKVFMGDDRTIEPMDI